eukprot:scaffold112087_cov64-Attheya_sp.AAC.1
MYATHPNALGGGLFWWGTYMVHGLGSPPILYSFFEYWRGSLYYLWCYKAQHSPSRANTWKSMEINQTFMNFNERMLFGDRNIVYDGFKECWKNYPQQQLLLKCNLQIRH